MNGEMALQKNHCLTLKKQITEIEIMYIYVGRQRYIFMIPFEPDSDTLKYLSGFLFFKVCPPLINPQVMRNPVN